MTVMAPEPVDTSEVVDLADELRPTREELKALAKAPPFVELPVDMGRLTGHAADYQWATWLADVLREAGCSVVEHPGWKTRGRPRSAGPFTPRGVIVHHDASAEGSSPAMARFIAEQGRPEQGIPAPLAQTWVCAGCKGEHSVGTWHVLAAGRANHAGIGSGWGAIGVDEGNDVTIGVETDNTTGEKTPAAMLVSLEVGCRAIFARLNTDPDQWLCGHKEYAAGRKVDPDDIDLDQLRTAVKGDGPKPPTPAKPAPASNDDDGMIPFPGAEHFTSGHHCTEDWPGMLKGWLTTIDGGPQLKGPVYTRATARRVGEFQAAHPRRIGKEAGDVGPKTWRALQLLARKAGD